MRYICSAELFFWCEISHWVSYNIYHENIIRILYIIYDIGVDIKIPIVRYSIFVKLQTQFLKAIFTLTQNIRFIDQLW